MTFSAALLMPIALLLPNVEGALRVEPAAPTVEIATLHTGFTDSGVPKAAGGDYAEWHGHLETLGHQGQNQVRIEQRMTIRIVPRPAPRVNILTPLPDGEVEEHLVEKKMAKCVPVSGIVGVQVGGPSNLILFMRDRSMVNAALERSCRARDFYSGFYLQRSTDGKLCVDRDTLLSRSGANCQLTRFRQLVPADD